MTVKTLDDSLLVTSAIDLGIRAALFQRRQRADRHTVATEVSKALRPFVFSSKDEGDTAILRQVQARIDAMMGVDIKILKVYADPTGEANDGGLYSEFLVLTPHGEAVMQLNEDLRASIIAGAGLKAA